MPPCPGCCMVDGGCPLGGCCVVPARHHTALSILTLMELLPLITQPGPQALYPLLLFLHWEWCISSFGLKMGTLQSCRSMLITLLRVWDKSVTRGQREADSHSHTAHMSPNPSTFARYIIFPIPPFFALFFPLILLSFFWFSLPPFPFLPFKTYNTWTGNIA